MSRTCHIAVRLDSGETRQFDVARDGRSLADVLAAHGLPLNTRCGQRGICRGCEVELCEGSLLTGLLTPPFPPGGGEGVRRTDEGEVSARIAAPATVKACKAQMTGDIAIYLPARSRIEHRPHVSEVFEIAVPYAHQPLFPVSGGRDTSFAVDVGTTTVVVLLVDLMTGDVLSRAGGFNQQIRFGDNVVTRIEAAQKPGKLAAMQQAVVAQTIQPLLLRALERAGRQPDRIAGGTIAANTTMLHLLAGEDPAPLGVAPFTPRFIAGKRLLAHDIGLQADGLAPETPIQLLPGIAAYIGADIVAGILATGMTYDPSPGLLVDIGTNGEIVLQAGGKLFGCATAAGPAFEGCGLACGTRARAGAVSDLNLRWNPFSLKTGIIGDVPLSKADGICGSAYLDFLATARQGGLLDARGRFDPAVWEQLPDPRRFQRDGQRAFRLCEKNGADDLRVSEFDVALLLQAKAAIGAGIEVLLETAGIRASDVAHVYLAGGFGMHLDVAHAIAIGLLPGFRTDQIRVVGNTSLAGALLALVDRTLLDEMESLRTLMDVVELNLTEGFEDRYVDHLPLP